ncbi:hypothetical protein [Thalassobacillus hwangdonensis]|uniref:G5 domain-containing protein n=1 Tax=Thalassobacillus hwangdonensis TaxID=546108 RepID=A0ABW3L081_9BACI
MYQKNNLKLYSIVIISSVLVLILSQVSTGTIKAISGNEAIIEKDIQIATLQLEGTSEQEARELLTAASLEWLEKHPVIIEMGREEVILDPSFITFQIDQTLQSIQTEETPLFTVKVDPEKLNVLKESFGEEVFSQFKQQQFLNDVSRSASRLAEQPMTYSFYDYVAEDAAGLREVVSEFEVKVPDEVDILSLAEEMNGIEIPGDATFSFLSHLMEDAYYDQDVLNVMATGIYGAALSTNFIVKERAISHQLPAYATLGSEASIHLEKGQDLKLYNPNDAPYYLELSVSNGVLVVKIKGFPLPDDYEVKVENKMEIKPDTVMQFSSLLDVDEVKTEQEGRPGVAGEVYRYSLGDDYKELIAEDYYPAVPTIEIHSSEKQQKQQASSNESEMSNEQGGTNTSEDTSGENPTNREKVDQDSNDTDENSQDEDGSQKEQQKQEGQGSDDSSESEYIWEIDPEGVPSK